MADVVGDARLSRLHWGRLDRIRERTIRQVLAAWRVSPDPAAAIVRVLAMQSAVIDQTDAYISTAAALATGTTGRPLGIDPGPLIGRHGRNNARFLEDVYGPAANRFQQDGFAAGVSRLRQAIITDAQLAQRNAVAARVQADRRIVGYKRQINPVAGGQTCGLCIAASTQLYKRQALLPIHPMCRCSVVPIFSTDPVPASGPFDRDALQSVYDRAGQTGAEDLRNVRFNFDQLPATVDGDAIRALDPRVTLHPEFGLYLTGARHDSAFSLT